MTVRVNLLPHREERRKRARQHFYIVAGGTALIGALVVVAMHTYVGRLIEGQEDRNRFLKGEIAKLVGKAEKGTGYLDEAAYQRTVKILMAGGSDPVISKEPQAKDMIDLRFQ